MVAALVDLLWHSAPPESVLAQKLAQINMKTTEPHTTSPLAMKQTVAAM